MISDPFTIGSARLEFVNHSGATGLTYPGTPTSSLALNYNNDFENGDPLLDLMVSISDQDSRLYRGAPIPSSGAPVFEDVRDDAFPLLNDRPQAGLRGLAVADFDNQYGPDIFAAAATGARLYVNQGPDAGGQYTFVDASSSMGLHTGGAVDDSWCAEWVDYDGDLDLDLFVGRAVSNGETLDPSTIAAASPVLFRNDGGTLTNVTSAVGLSGTSTATVTALWAYVDDDAYLDLILGDLRTTGACQLYVGSAAGTFTEDTATLGSLPGSVNSLAWADMDNDGRNDLVIGQQDVTSAQPLIYLQVADGVYGSTPVAVNAGILASGMKVFDQNNDGRLDILLIPVDANDSPKLLGNFEVTQGMGFADLTSRVGLDAAGAVRGAIVADFDHDAHPDVYLGRPQAQQTHYFRGERIAPPTPEDPEHRQIAVALEGGGVNNSSGVGATITFKRDGLAFHSQAMRSGNSQSGSSGLVVSSGIGQQTGTFEAEVAWPEGNVQTELLEANRLTIIQDDTDPSIQASSMEASYAPSGPGTSTVTFEWVSTNGSLLELDTVVMSASGGCLPSSPLVLTPDMPNVSCTHTAEPGGGIRHTMTVTDMSCTTFCSYSWYCTSSTNFVSSSTQSNPKSFTTKICAQ